MPTFRVAVTYTVDVVDAEALHRAGADRWAASSGGWMVAFDDGGGVRDATGEELAAVVPTAEASIAWVLGDVLGYPAVPGVRFTSMSVDVQPDGAPAPS